MHLVLTPGPCALRSWRHCPSEEEISNMRSELEKYGIQMPVFSKIGGLLANELSVDEAARKSHPSIGWVDEHI